MIQKDVEKGHRIAELLYNAFAKDGIHGHKVSPEDSMPKGITKGSLEHILFLTLTVSIDYQRDADALWSNSRLTFEDPNTHYLFEPLSLHKTPLQKVREDMRRYGLSQKPNKDAHIWRTVGVTFHKQWGGDPRNLLAACEWDAVTVLTRLKDSSHVWNGRRFVDYPYLRGNKIGPLWLRMLWDNADLTELQNLAKVPIPVDIHVARATLALGVVRGSYNGRLEELFKCVRIAWFESMNGLRVGDRKMIALDVDEPLWHLSKHGCRKRDSETGLCDVRDTCEAREFCTNGRIEILKSQVELQT